MIPLPSNEFLSGGLILVIVTAALAYFRTLPGKIYDFFERFCVIRLEIHDEDESFQWMNIWLAKKLDGTLSIASYVRRKTHNDYEEEPDYDDGTSKDKKKRPDVVFVPAAGLYFTWYKGKFCIIDKQRDNSPKLQGGTSVSKPKESINIRVFSRDLDLPKKMLEEARDLALPLDGKVEVRTSRNTYWNLVSRIRGRALDSVILEDNIGQVLLEDLKRFVESPEWYNKLGIPYRRGYLLYGSPGNGKSSIVSALASTLEMNINILNLNSVSDDSLGELLSSCGQNTIVLIEDVDCAFAKREAEEKKLSLLTFSGLLNALDGVVAQEGRIVFLTTNHREKLDPALIRPGRVDVQFEIKNATKKQALTLFRRFYPKSVEELAFQFVKQIEDYKLSMASLQGHLEIYKDHPEKAVEMVGKLYENK
jgi:chaperone BCS1